MPPNPPGGGSWPPNGPEPAGQDGAAEPHHQPDHQQPHSLRPPPPPRPPLPQHPRTAPPSNSKKRRASASAGSRGVAHLSAEQLAKKRANDREAQRAIRERTKNQIAALEARIQELTAQQPYQELQLAVRRRELVEAENEEVRRRLAHVLSVLQPLLAFQNGGQEAAALSAKLGVSNLGGGDPLAPPQPTVAQASPSSFSDMASTTAYPVSPASSGPGPSLPHWPYPGAPPAGQAKVPSPSVAFDAHKPALGLAPGLDVAAAPLERLGLDFLLDGSQRGQGTPDGTKQQLLAPRASPAGSHMELDHVGKRSPSLPRSSSAPGLPQTDGYGPPVRPGTLLAHSTPISNIAPTCPLDGLLLEFLHERQQHAAKGMTAAQLVGPAYPSIASLLDPERSMHSHPLSKVFTDVVSTFPDLDQPPEQIAVLYIMFLMVRWQVLPTQENYDRLPHWITPRASQLFTPHPAWVDHLPWPLARDVLVRDYVNYPLEDFFIPYTMTLSLNWPYDPRDTMIMPTDPAGEILISPAFERHLRDLNNWSLGPAFAKAFPELAEKVRINPKGARSTA
ncbi:MAG: hypothetical protein M1832_002289 [Thelocarpon impressellum]|nr:MAG: hypothetical protein M1832_002289 [Thelocarpon impressellum]